MDNNYVHLVGVIKRSETGDSGVLNFAVEVPDERGTLYIYDCICTSRSEAFNQLEGFVNEGEPIEVVGHLTKRTTSESVRVSGARIDVRNTQILVYVDSVVTEEEDVD